MHSSTGRWATYNTPSNGVRRASAHQIVFQAREGSPELNCCSVNSPRGLGLVGQWALLRDGEGPVLNWYGPSQMAAPLGRGLAVTLTQRTDYPLSGRVELAVQPSRAAEFTLRLRVPYWSRRTRVAVNGRGVAGAEPGTYLALRRRWRRGDRVRVELDLSPHFWAGAGECAGRASIYRGPVLLAFDHRYNLHLAAGRDPQIREIDGWKGQTDCMLALPTLEAEGLRLRRAAWRDWLPPALLLAARDAEGRTVRLCDYGSAGEAGTPYVTWLPVRGAPSADFSPGNPLRTARPAGRK